MKRILIATHGELAEGAKNTVEFLIGTMAEITCITAYVNPEVNVETEIENYFKGVKEEDQVIVLTDVKSGSVNQKMVPYAAKPNVFLIAGFNLALLIELAMTMNQITDEYLQQTIDSCRNEMTLVKPEIPEDSDDDFLE